MKNLISTTLLLITFLSSSLNAQQISSANYNQEFIHEDFNQEGKYFKIVTTADNYFILDKGDYLLSRNNNESEYAIIANNSSVSNFILKTSVRLGPTNNKEASIGIILKAQQDGKGAIIFEINKKGEYRIKQLLGNNYKILSGSRNGGWVKSKIINGVDEHNSIEIRTENNIYDVYVNSDYLKSFFISDYNNGSCGLIISPEAKARVAYYHINTKGGSISPATSYAYENTNNTNTGVEELNTKERKNQEGELELLREKNNNQATITIQQEKEIASLNRSITNLKNSNLKVEELEKTISKNTALISNLTNEKNALSTNVNELSVDASSLNTKNAELATVTIEQEKEIVSLKSAITKLKSKSTSASSTNKQLTENIDDLKQQVTLEKSANTSLKNNLNKTNKLSNSKIKKLTTQINTLETQIKTTTNKNTSLTTNLSAEKIAHSKTKNSLSNSVTNKSAKIKALETQLNTTSQQLKSADKNGVLAKEYSKNAATLTKVVKNLKKEITALENIKNKHDDIVNDLNSQLSLINAKKLVLNAEVQALNIKTSKLETTNIELKELFILKDFEVNGVTPSELIKQTSTYPAPKEIKGSSTIYAVQFGVFMQVQAYSTLKTLDEVWYETTEHGTYVYLSGQFKNPQEATAHKNKVADLGYPNAFVVTLRK